MELLYIWIEDYKNIKRQGFNFSAKYRFEFKITKEENGKVTSGELKGTENPNYIENFFDEKGNITNVTAIVGKNGSGKSSLLSGIAKNMISSNKYILVFQIDNTLYLDSSIKVSGNFIKSSFYTEYENRFIYYYNPFFSGRLPTTIGIPPEVAGINDISIDNFVNGGDIRRFYIEELRRITNFLTSPQRQSIDDIVTFLPEKLFMGFGIFYYRSNLNPDSPMGILARFLENIKDKNSGTYRLLAIKSSLILAIYNHHQFSDYKRDIDNIIEKGISEATVNELIYYIKKISTIERSTNIYPDEIIRRFEEITYIINREFISSSDEQGLYIEFSERNNPMLNNLFDSLSFFSGAPRHLQIFTIDYRIKNTSASLSSGELVLLKLFSSFYVTKWNQYPFAILFIDEGELGMHPQWQKKYLKMIIDVFPLIFEGKKIQLVLASHSPFLLSDLPKENVIFLEKDKETEFCKVSDLRERQRTFGQNIFDLFADSFFMQNGLIGEFANKKIEDTVRKLKSLKELAEKDKTVPTKELNQLLNMVEIIGDDFIRLKLREYYDSIIALLDNSPKSRRQKLLSELKEVEDKAKNIRNELTKSQEEEENNNESN